MTVYSCKCRARNSIRLRSIQSRIKDVVMCLQNGTTVPVHGTLRLTRKMRVLDRHGCYRDQQEHLWSHQEGPIGSMLGSSEMHRMASRAFVPGSGNSAVDTPSIETGLIQCKYEVQSVVRPSSGCCGTCVTAVLPLTVIATPFQEPDFTEPPRPQGWNPQVFDNQVCTFALVVFSQACVPICNFCTSVRNSAFRG